MSLQDRDPAARPVLGDAAPDDEAPDDEGGSRAVEIFVAALFVLSIVAGLALGGVYVTGGQPQAEGILLALALGGIGVGMVVWAKRFLPDQEVVEERKPIESPEDDIAAFTADFERGTGEIGRRKLLVRLLLGALGALGVAAVFPIRSLGPRPGQGLYRTDYRPGLRVVTGNGEPVTPEQLPVGAVLTVWPEGHEGAADSPTLLISVGDPELFEDEVDVEGTVEGIVAYSKLCTHTGCPVGLYQTSEHLLLCPCHQSTFQVLRGARPIFGPAARSLPQLPIGLDDEGNIIALDDFEGPVSAGFWDRQQREREMGGDDA